MKKRISDIVLFIFSLIALIVSLILLRIYGAYEFSYGNGAVIADGGWFMIIMNMIRLVVLFTTCVISGIKLFKSSK